MLKSLLITATAILMGLSSAQANSIDQLSFYTEDSPPLNFVENGPKGIAVDILAEIFKRTGAQKTISDVKLVPWARGYEALNSGPKTILFTTAKTSDRTPLFKWVGPITKLNIGVLTKKNGPKISSAADLNSLKIASVRDDVGEQLLLSETDYPEASLKRSSLESTIKKLDAGRVDAVVFMELPARYKIGKLGYKQEDFVIAHEFLTLDLYFAASKDVSDATISLMQKAMDEIREDGSLDKIIAKYL